MEICRLCLCPCRSAEVLIFRSGSCHRSAVMGFQTLFTGLGTISMLGRTQYFRHRLKGAAVLGAVNWWLVRVLVVMVLVTRTYTYTHTHQLIVRLSRSSRLHLANYGGVLKVLISLGMHMGRTRAVMQLSIIFSQMPAMVPFTSGGHSIRRLISTFGLVCTVTCLILRLCSSCGTRYL